MKLWKLIFKEKQNKNHNGDLKFSWSVSSRVKILKISLIECPKVTNLYFILLKLIHYDNLYGHLKIFIPTIKHLYYHEIDDVINVFGRQ